MILDYYLRTPNSRCSRPSRSSEKNTRAQLLLNKQDEQVAIYTGQREHDQATSRKWSSEVHLQGLHKRSIHNCDHLSDPCLIEGLHPARIYHFEILHTWPSETFSGPIRYTTSLREMHHALNLVIRRGARILCFSDNRCSRQVDTITLKALECPATSSPRPFRSSISRPLRLVRRDASHPCASAVELLLTSNSKLGLWSTQHAQQKWHKRNETTCIIKYLNRARRLYSDSVSVNRLTASLNPSKVSMPRRKPCTSTCENNHFRGSVVSATYLVTVRLSNQISDSGCIHVKV